MSRVNTTRGLVPVTFGPMLSGTGITVIARLAAAPGAM
jgi:hypothetical protein